MIQVPSFSYGDALLAINLQTMADAIMELQGMTGGGDAGNLVSDAHDPVFERHKEVFIATLDSAGNGKWTEDVVAAGTVAAWTTGGRACSNTSDPSDMITLRGAQIIVLQIRDANGTDHRYIQLPWAGLYPCNVTQSGGSDGNATTAPTYTYLFGTDIVTGIAILNDDLSTPSAQSPETGHQIGSFTAATKGTYYWNSSGNPVLWEVFEKEVACT